VGQIVKEQKTVTAPSPVLKELQSHISRKSEGQSQGTAPSGLGCST